MNHKIECPRCCGSGKVEIPDELEEALIFVKSNPHASSSQVREAMTDNPSSSLIVNRLHRLCNLGFLVLKEVSSPTGGKEYTWATSEQTIKEKISLYEQAFCLSECKTMTDGHGYLCVNAKREGIEFEMAIGSKDTWFQLDEYIPGESSKMLRVVVGESSTIVCGSREMRLCLEMQEGLRRMGLQDACEKAIAFQYDLKTDS